MSSSENQANVKYLILGILFCSILGCASPSSKYEYTNELVLQDSLKLKIDSFINPMTNNLQHINWKNKNLLAYASECNLILFDLKEKNILKKIEYEKNGPNGIGRVAGFHFHNFDSIFITSGMPWNIIITDSAAKVIDKIKLDHLKIGGLNPAILFPSVTNYRNTVIKVREKYFFSTYLASSTIGDLEFSDIPVGVYYNFSDHEAGTGPFNFPKLDKEKHLPVQHHGFSREFDNQKWVYSFIYDHNLYVRKIDDDNYKIKAAKSKLSTSNNLYRAKASGFDLLVNAAKDPQYKSLIYDRWREVFYRLFYPGIEVSSNKEEIDYYSIIKSPRNFSVMILNKELEVIGETEMPKNTYDPNTYFVNEDGLYFGLSATNPDFDPDHLKFARFSVEELNNANQ